MSRIRRVVALVVIAMGVVISVLCEPVMFLLERIRWPRGRGRHSTEAALPSSPPTRLPHETGP